MKQSTSFAHVATNLLNVLQGYTKTIRLLLVMFLTLTVTTNAWGADYELVSFSDIKTNDVIIIVGTKSSTAYAMKNTGTPPTPIKVTISNSKITSTATDITFTATNNGDNTITFVSTNSGTLYCTDANNGVKIGTQTGDNTKFSFDSDVKRLKNKGQTRWLGIYNTQDWRCYTSASAANISGTTTTFYRKVTAAPSFTVTATSNNNNYGTVSVSGTTITASPKTGYTYANPAYTVTSGTATVTQNGNTFTVSPSTNCTVRINFEAKPKYTVTLKDDDSELTQSTAGGSVTLPERADCGDWTFAGWYTSEVEQTNIEPDIIEPGDYTPTADITLYPVYTMTEGGSGNTTGSKTFTLSTIAKAMNWENGTAYTSIEDDPVTITALGGGNNGKWYTSSNGSWRMYSGGTVQITANGGTITSVTSTPTCDFTINDDKATFSPSARTDFTKFVVEYSISGGATTTYTSTPDCATQPSRYLTPKHRGGSGGT